MKSVAISRNQSQSVAISRNQSQSDAIRRNQAHSSTDLLMKRLGEHLIRRNQAQSGAISGNQRDTITPVDEAFGRGADAPPSLASPDEESNQEVVRSHQRPIRGPSEANQRGIRGSSEVPSHLDLCLLGQPMECLSRDLGGARVRRWPERRFVKARLELRVAYLMRDAIKGH